MTIPTKKEFAELAEVHGSRCLSLFIPTHKSGQAVLEQEDRILFKNLLVKVEKEMIDRGFGHDETLEFLEPARNLMNDPVFWRHQEAGLAFYLGRTFHQYFKLPFRVEPFFYLSHEFYLKPLVPFFTGDGDFFLLSLNFHEVKFFKGNRSGIEPVYVKDLIPQQVEEVVGFDYRQKFHGFHSGSGSGSTAVFHGHADWQEDQKDEVLSFFRAIDKNLSVELEGETAPLVIASLDYLYPIYKHANTYPFLFDGHVSGNPEYTTNQELHQKAWNLLSSHFDLEHRTKAARYAQLAGTARTSTDIHEIIPAAKAGRIDALFLDARYEIWGVYDIPKDEVRVHETQNLSNTSLINLATVYVLQNGGKVYLEDREHMPDRFSGVNALLRY